MYEMLVIWAMCIALMLGKLIQIFVLWKRKPYKDAENFPHICLLINL
jgi:hypothetical protein